MNVYLAAPWKFRADAKQVAQQIREAGYCIKSRWHDEWGDVEEAPAQAGNTNPDVLLDEATADYDDVKGSDVMIVLNLEKSEGKAVEQGLALAWDKPVIVVGSERFNVFQYLPSFSLVATVHDALEHLKRIKIV